MAYFGGTKSERPWPKLNMQVVGFNVFMILFCIMMGFTLFGKDTPTQAPVPVVETKSESAYQKILVANQDISPGEVLSPGMFRLENRPIEGIERYTVSDTSFVKDKYASALMIKDAPVLKPYINTTGHMSNAVTRQIPTGYRAVTVPVNSISGIEGWILPGSHVDVVWSTTHRKKEIISIIVENALVVSAGKNTQVNPKEVKDAAMVPSTVTLVVPLKSAQKINLAKASNGKITLSLRGDEDNESVGSEITSLDGLIKANDLQLIESAQGVVRIEGQDYQMKSGELVPSETKETSLTKSKRW